VICPLIGLTRHGEGSNLGAGSRWPWVLPPSLAAAAHLKNPTDQQMSVASNWPRKPFVQVQKYPDLVLNALTLYNCNCHSVGGTKKKEGTPNTQSTWFSLTNWSCSILKQKLHLDKEETHSLIHFFLQWFWIGH
jgi:hypothetical protein